MIGFSGKQRGIVTSTMVLRFYKVMYPAENDTDIRLDDAKLIRLAKNRKNRRFGNEPLKACKLHPGSI